MTSMLNDTDTKFDDEGVEDDSFIVQYLSPDKLKQLKQNQHTLFHEMIAQTAERAYTYLSKRSPEQLNKLSIDYYGLWFQLECIPEEERFESTHVLVISTPHWLIRIIPYTDLTHALLPDVDWAEYFVMMALSDCFSALDTLELTPNLTGSSLQDMLQDNLLLTPFFSSMQNAQMALVYAELLTEHQPEPPKKDKIKFYAGKGGQAKNAATNAIKRDFIRYCEQHDTKPSVRELALRFYEGLPPERQRLLKPTNAVKVLAQSWTDYKKGRLPEHFWHTPSA